MITKALCPVVVDRESEINRLEDALLSAVRGDGNLAVLSGDAGIGKSRLATELRRRAQRLGATVMEGGCPEAELAIPYFPFNEAISNYLAGADLDSLRVRLGAARRELARLFPQLGDEKAPDAGASDGSQAKLRLYEAVFELFRIAAATSGLLLIVEDLHWADDSTRELLDYIGRRLRSNRILMLVSYRRDELHRKHPLLPTIQGWRRSRLADFIDLEPLGPEGVGRMVSAIFDEPTRPDTRDFLHARCEGNPFVLEEILKAALDRGDVYRTGSGWTRKSLVEIRLPETVVDSILLRVERLTKAQADVLRTASVLGRSFEYPLLRALCGGEVEDELAALAQQQLIEEEPGGHGRHRFRHALTQEAIYGSLATSKRQRIHGEAAMALKGERTAPAVDIAHHLLRANLQDEALPILMRAADSAEGARAYREAAELRQRALEAVEDAGTRAKLTGQVGETLWLAGRAEAAIPYLEEAIDALTGHGSIAEAEHLRLIHGRVQMAHNRHDLAMLDYQRAAEALTTLGPSADLARALMLQGALESISHRAELAEPLLLAAIEIATQVGADDVRIWSLQYLATPLVDANQYEEAVELTEQSYREALAAGMVAIAESALNNLNSDYLWWPRPDHFQSAIDRLHALGTEVGATLALKWESIAAYYDGRLADSLAIATRMLEVATRLGNPREMEGAGRHIATVSSLLGRLDQARPYVVRPNPDEGIQAAVDRVGTWCRFHLANGDATLAAEGASVVVSDPGALVRALPWLDCVMEALLAAGELEDARSLARAAVVQPGYDGQPYLLVVAARLELAEGRTDAAVELARRAAELFGTVGDRVDGLSARIVLAQALTDAGRTDEATREVSRCLDDSRRIQARYFEEKASALARRIGFEMPESPTEAPVVEIGEKLVTVLFADIRGYTAMTTGLPPAELADRISAFQRWAQHEVNRHRGLIDKFAGDAVMATFNASGTSIDHSQHALEAAIALRDKAALLDLQIGVGIAVGPAIVGRLAMGANVSVLGETTNLASRLEGQASASEILLSAEGYRRVKDWLSAQGYQASRDTLELKGIARPAEAWRVGSRGLEAPTATSADDRFPLTKREREVAIMVADGLTNKQIATRLFRSERVIDNHVQHCFTKLGIHNRVELTRWVIDRGLVGADEADLSAPFKW